MISKRKSSTSAGRRPTVCRALAALAVVVASATALLCANAPAAAAAPPPSVDDHAVVEGETLSILARCRATTVERIVDLDPDRFDREDPSTWDLIWPNERLVLPPAPPTIDGWPGLTLGALADCEDMTPEAIAAANPRRFATSDRGQPVGPGKPLSLRASRDATTSTPAPPPSSVPPSSSSAAAKHCAPATAAGPQSGGPSSAQRVVGIATLMAILAVLVTVQLSRRRATGKE